MARIDLKIRPGLTLDDSGFSVGEGGYIAADKVRLWRGQPEIIGGWEAITTEAVSGKARGMLSWRDNNDVFNVAIGTHTGLYVVAGGRSV